MPQITHQHFAVISDWSGTETLFSIIILELLITIISDQLSIETVISIIFGMVKNNNSIKQQHLYLVYSLELRVFISVA